MKEQKAAGVILSYLGQIVHIISGLLFTPIMLDMLGDSEYGLYNLVFSTVSYMSLLSLGFSSSYMRFYSRYKAQKDEKGIARLNGMFLSIFIVISIVCLICGAILVTGIEVVFADGLTASEYSLARKLMALMTFNLALTFPNSVFDSITSSKECFFFQKILIVAQNVLNPFITIPLLLMGYGSIYVVMVTTILSIAKLIVNGWFCIKRLKAKFDFKKFDFSLLKEMSAFTFFIFIGQIVDQINWHIDSVLLGRFMGTTATAVYGVGAQINSLYIQLSTAVSNVFIPQVNRIVAESNDDSKLSKVFTKVGRIQFAVLFLVLSGFIFFGKQFIVLWTDESKELAYYVVLLLIVPVTVPLIQNIGIEIQRAKNMHKSRSLVYLGIAVLNILISIPSIKYFGIPGAAFGTAFALIAGNVVFINWYYYKIMKLDVIYFWKSIFSFIPSLILPLIAGSVLVHIINVNSWLKLIICIAVYTVVYLVSLIAFGLNSEEKQMLSKFTRKFKKHEVVKHE